MTCANELQGVDSRVIEDFMVGDLDQQLMDDIRVSDLRRRMTQAELIRRRAVSCGNTELGDRLAVMLSNPAGSLTGPVLGAWLGHTSRGEPGSIEEAAVLFAEQGTLPMIHLGSGMTVRLETSDPARILVTPTATDAERVEVDAWDVLLRGAWQLLVERHRRWVPGIEALLEVIIPADSHGAGEHVSASSIDALGAIGLSLTEDLPTLAVGILHEVQHLKVGALLNTYPVHRADATARFRVEWRPGQRPFEALLQGVAAFVGVADFWRVEAERQEGPPGVRQRAEREYARWYPAVITALDEVRHAGALEPVGLDMLAGFTHLASDWWEPNPDWRTAGV